MTLPGTDTRPGAILVHYFFAPMASIVIDANERILTEESARAMEMLVKAGILYRELAPDISDEAVRYGLTPAGSQLMKSKPEILTGPVIEFDLTEPLLQDPEVPQEV